MRAREMPIPSWAWNPLGSNVLSAWGFDGGGQRPDLAVSENSVYVEEYEANAAGTLSGRKIHSLILRTRMMRRLVLDTTFVFSLHLAFNSG